MRQILSFWSIKNFKNTATIRILVSALLFSALQVVAVSISPVANAAAAVSPEPMGLNYKRNYFEVSGGLSPSNSNFTVEAYVRVNANVPSGDTPESLIIIGNAGGGMIVKIVSLSPAVIYIGEAWSSSTQFTCSSNISLKTWYQVTVVQDAIGSGAWLNGVSCGTRGRNGYSAASQVGGQSNPPRFTLDGDIASLIFSNQALFAYNASSITVPAPDAANPAGTTFSLKTNSIKAKDGTGNHTLTAVSNGGSITASQVFLVDQSIAFGTSSYSIAYGATQQLSISGTSGTGAVTYSAGSSTACSVGSTGLVNVTAATGTCSISASIAADSIYNAATTTTPVTITVGPASSTIVATGSNTFTYTGTAQGPSSSTVTGSTGLVTYSYSGSGSTSYGPSTTKPTNVGSYTTTASVAASGNYAIASSAAYSFNISQAAQVTSPAITSTVGTLGANLTLITSGGSGGGTNSFNVDSGPCTVLGSTLSATAAGTCMVTATKAANGNYLAASSLSTEITIDKATPTFTWSGLSKTYGVTAFDLTAPSPSTAGTWIYASGTPSVISLTGISATVAGYGTAVITATFTPDDAANYVSGGTIAMTVTVSKATLGITASSHTVAFGGAVPTITSTYSGFVSGDTSSVVAGTSCSTIYTTTTSVGTTGSSCSGATASNYSFAYTAGVITVTQGGQTSALTITSTSVTYGSTLSLTTGGGTGSGSNSFVVDSGPCTVSGSTLSTTAAGTCMVTATKAANGNYLVSSSASTAITVNPKGLSITGLTGVNKEFDQGVLGTVTGTPTLFGKVGSDDVLLSGTPTFAFGSGNVENGQTLTGSGYTLAGTTAGNYTLTQPTVTANITAKAARVAATNTTVAYGAAVTSGVTASGLISPDAVRSASYTYTGTGTSTPPTAVGVYTVTPSNAVFSTGLIGNYTISYDTATVTILAKYTITYNANGGVIGSDSTTSVDFVVGDTALALPTATREGFNFLGWFTLESNGVQVTGAYTPTATATLWAQWIQKSLVGVGNSQKIGTITTLANVGNTYSATSTGGTVAVTYVANALPVGTIIDIYQMSDSSRASSIISSTNNYVLSLVIAWLTPTKTVPLLSANDALTMVITDSAIKKGAKVYSLIGSDATLLGTATADGSVIVRILEDPEVYVAITKPDAPTGVSATSGGNASTTVSWTAPSDGGSAITLYTATSSGGQSCTSTTTSCSVSGLADATSYTFTVTATNVIGTSDPSSASSAIVTQDSALLIAAQQAAALAAQQAAAAQAAAALAAQQAAAQQAAAQQAAAQQAAAAAQQAAAVAAQEAAAQQAAALAARAAEEARVAELARIAEEKRIAELARIAEEKRVAELARIAEEKRIAELVRIAEEARVAELARIAEEKRVAELALLARIAQIEEELAYRAEQERISEQRKIEEYLRGIELARIAEEARVAELARITEEARTAELARIAEEARIAKELAASKIKAEEELKAAAALKIAEEQRIAAALAESKKITTMYSTSAAFKLNKTYTKRLNTNTKKIAAGSTVTCIGYAKSSKTLTYAKAKVIATKRAKTLCTLMKKINPTLKTMSIVYPASKAPVTSVNKKWIPVSYRIVSPVN